LAHLAPPDKRAQRVTPARHRQFASSLVRIAFAAETTKFLLVLFARAARPTERSARRRARRQPLYVYVGDLAAALHRRGILFALLHLTLLLFREYKASNASRLARVIAGPLAQPAQSPASRQLPAIARTGTLGEVPRLRSHLLYGEGLLGSVNTRLSWSSLVYSQIGLVDLAERPLISQERRQSGHSRTAAQCRLCCKSILPV
jgi:hypothetical protein